MKKTTLFMALALGALVANAQTNILKNGDFAEWNDEKGVPASWSGYDATFSQVDGTCQIENTGETAKLRQYANNLEAGQYTISFEYNIVKKGTPTSDKDQVKSARVWCVWTNYVDGKSTTVDPVGDDKAKMQGPDNSYLPDEEGKWQSYTATVTLPEGANSMTYEVRTYRSSTVQFKNCSLVKVGGSGFETIEANAPSFYALNGELVVSNVAEGTTVEIYNALGARVQTNIFDGGAINVSDLAKGIYVVRAGKDTQKVMF